MNDFKGYIVPCYEGNELGTRVENSGRNQERLLRKWHFSLFGKEHKGPDHQQSLREESMCETPDGGARCVWNLRGGELSWSMVSEEGMQCYRLESVERQWD